jgi:hypothetical protein
MTKTPSPCCRRTLAAGEFAIVEHCSCGAAHLTIGAITLRLAAGAIAPLAATLSEAARSLVLDAAFGDGRHHGEVVS